MLREKHLGEIMSETPMILSAEDMLEIESSIVTTEGMGARIRQILGEYHGGDFDINSYPGSC